MDGPRIPNETADVADVPPGPTADEVPGAASTPSAPSAPLPTRPFLPPRYRRSVAIVGIAAVVVALIGTMLVWRSDSGTDAADSSPKPGPSASASAPDAQVPTVAPGVRLAASAWTPVAELTAEDVTAGVVGLASTFRLASLDATPAAELARRLTVVPQIAFSVKADADGRTVRITPTEPLTAGAVYRFSLAAADGHDVGSWAFQAHQPFRVVGTLPGDTETDVPLDTGIEITFDQDGVVDAESHVTIEPPVDGRFEQHGRSSRSCPNMPLEPATMYTVTCHPGHRGRHDRTSELE